MRRESSTDRLLDKPVFSFMLLLTISILVSCGSSEDDKTGIQLHLAAAENFRSRGQYQAAEIESRNAIQTDPADSRGYTSLANIYIETGRAKAAIKILEEFEGQGAEYVLTTAKAYLSAGKLRSAGDVLENNAAILADHQLALNLLLGDVATARGNLELAKERYNEVLVEDESNIAAKLGLASVAAREDDIDAAEILLDKILQADPGNAKALLFSSSLQAKKGNLDRAEELLTDAIVATPPSDIITPIRYSILVSLRDILTRQGKTTEALIYSGLLAESTPGMKELNDKLQNAMDTLSAGNFDSAREALADILLTSPASEQAGTMLGVLEYLQGNNEAAVQQFELFVDPETATPAALQIFALAELKLNQPQKVLDRLKREIDTSKNAKLLALYGIAALSSNELDTGEKYLLKAVELDPADGRLRLPLVRFYNTQGAPAKALVQIKEAFKSQPDDALIQAGYIQQLMTSGDLDKAADLVKGIRSGYPDSADTQLLVARFQLSQQNLDEAAKTLDRVLSLGESIQARFLIARINLNQQNYTAAESEYRAIIQADPENRDAYKGLITAYELQKKPEEGITVVVGMAEQSGATAPILVLSEYHGRNGNFDRAFELLAPLQDPTPIEKVQLMRVLYLTKANQALRSGNIQQGRETLLKGLTHSPDNPALLAVLVSVEIRARQLDEATKIVKKLEKIVPAAPIVNILTGDIAVANKDYSLAYTHYQLAWQIQPTDQVAGKIYGSLINQANKDKQLLAFLEAWEEKLPESQFLGLSRAGYYMQSGEMVAARVEYEALLLKFGNLAIAHNNLAWIYGENELNKALAAGKRAYELAPQSPEIMDTYAWFLFKTGDVKQAKELLAKAVDLAPENEEIRQHLEEVSNQT